MIQKLFKGRRFPIRPRVFFILLICGLLSCPVPAHAQNQPQSALDPKGTMNRGPAARTASAQSDLALKKVLILHSFASGQAVYQIIDESLKQAFASSGVDF